MYKLKTPDKQKELVGPCYPYGRRDKPGDAFVFTDHDHSPYNGQHPGNRHTAELKIDHGPDWVSFTITEHVRANSRTTTRTISTSMPREWGEIIAKHILAGWQPRQSDPYVEIAGQISGGGIPSDANRVLNAPYGKRK